MSYTQNSFPLVKGQVNLTTGTKGAGIFVCSVAGTLTVTWADASTVVVAAVAGDAFNLREGVTSVAITTGTFHMA